MLPCPSTACPSTLSACCAADWLPPAGVDWVSADCAAAVARLTCGCVCSRYAEDLVRIRREGNAAFPRASVALLLHFCRREEGNTHETKEMMQPCLIYLHAISLVARTPPSTSGRERSFSGRETPPFLALLLPFRRNTDAFAMRCCRSSTGWRVGVAVGEDCPSAAPPSPVSRRFNVDGEGMPAE